MLRIIVGGEEGYDEVNKKFVTINATHIELEHSLLSLSKWESQYQKPFLSSEKKTSEEIFGYFKAMVVTPDVDPDVLRLCSEATIDKVQAYIDSSQSATTFGQMPERQGPGEVITSELIYYWMVSFNIPFEVERWHLNRLFALVRICNIKNSKTKKMSKNEIAQKNRQLNEERRAKLGTRG